MNISITILDGPLPPARPISIGGAGAVLCFEGIVRPTEEARPIVALDYEAYEPMAQNQFQRLASDALSTPGVLAVHVQHSRGRVPAGACSFRLVVASRHRAEGLAALSRFIDQMKQDVPIWKRPLYAPE